ncbi:MAG: hypothetical protein WB608_03775 [Terracidiphilus sp.]
MGPQKLRVYNRAREDILSLGITVVDTTVEPLKKLIEDLAVGAGNGIWLTPYRGIPSAPGLPPFDVVYLDENQRVTQEVESYPSPEIKPLYAQAASALVLPAHTVFASHTRTGDQLEFSVVEDAAKAGSPNHHRAPSTPETRSRQLQNEIEKLDNEKDSHSPKSSSLGARFLRWLSGEAETRRRGDRHPLPGLVAYHWTGGAPKAYKIGDVSHSGFYLITEDRPFPGTIVLMTLQIASSGGEKPEDSIAVRTQVVRWGDDGVGYAFVFSMPVKSGQNSPENGADKKTLEEFLKRLNLAIS